MPPKRPLRRLSDLASVLVDPVVGIVRSVHEIPREPGAPRLHHFGAQACNTGAFARQENFGAAGGASLEREHAVAKAIGEAVERYCSAIYDASELPLATADEAAFPTVDPASFALYGPEQYGRDGFYYVPFEGSTPARWTPAADLATGRSVHLPAAMVYVPYQFRRDLGEVPFVQPISTGLACHASAPEAYAAGLCEVVERDAFTIHWQARLAPPRVPSPTLSRTNGELVARIEKAGGSAAVFDATLDSGIPTILAVLKQSAASASPLVVAASAHADPERAVRKALEELSHTRWYMRHLKLTMPPLARDSTFANVLDQESHLQAYNDPTNAGLADFLFASRIERPFPEIRSLATGEPEEDLQRLLRAIASTGHQAIGADVTTPDVADLGIHVVRVVIPGYHPLFMGHDQRALGGTRLWEIPQKLGHPGITPGTGDNPAPHPFP